MTWLSLCLAHASVCLVLVSCVSASDVPPLGGLFVCLFVFKALVLMLYGFCFFSTPGTLSELLEAHAGTPQPRTDPAHLPRDA